MSSCGCLCFLGKSNVYHEESRLRKDSTNNSNVYSKSPTPSQVKAIINIKVMPPSPRPEFLTIPTLAPTDESKTVEQVPKGSRLLLGREPEKSNRMPKVGEWYHVWPGKENGNDYLVGQIAKIDKEGVVFLLDERADGQDQIHFRTEVWKKELAIEKREPLPKVGEVFSVWPIDQKDAGSVVGKVVEVGKILLNNETGISVVGVKLKLDKPIIATGQEEIIFPKGKWEKEGKEKIDPA